MYTKAELDQLVETTSIMSKTASVAATLKHIILGIGTSNDGYRPLNMCIDVDTVSEKFRITIPERLYRDVLNILAEHYEGDLAQEVAALFDKRW